MELDPNAVFKAKFRELTELLGRTPNSADSGWLAIHEEYKKGWAPAEETVLAPKARVIDREGPTILLSDGTSSAPAWGPGSSEPLSGPGAPVINPEPVSVPSRGSLDSRGADRATGNLRGPGGGVLAICEACGQEWERPARRGRPALRCEECRNVRG